MSRLDDIARARLQTSIDAIYHAMSLARQGNPLAAEPDALRRRERLQAKAHLSRDQAAAIDRSVRERAGGDLDDAAEALGAAPLLRPDLREAIWGETADFVSVAFLARGAQTARAVGRVAWENGRPRGSGAVVGPGLFLTNHHVIETPQQAARMLLELDYERDLDGRPRAVSRFHFDPALFITDDVEGLDFTLIGVGPRRDGEARLESYGALGLSDARDKHMIGEFANIVQHPQGRFKEVVLRENRLVNRFDDALHYLADTEPGSSGAPVFNSEWNMIALHHWGGPWIDGVDDGVAQINEGIRISSIVTALRARLPDLAADIRARVAQMLARGAAAPLEATSPPPPIPTSARSVAPVIADGVARWTVPLEVSVRLPELAAPAAARPADPYAHRDGYDAAFLPGHPVPLPALGPAIAGDAAILETPAPGARRDELRYRHFSIVMNARRRLAFVTACNIDGTTSRHINRRTGAVSDLTPDDPGLNEAAEADSWRLDPRIPPQAQAGAAIYARQRVPGFPDPRAQARILRMFQKGHLVRRIDPAWGPVSDALEGELDSFHWTNAAPQVGFFNMGKAADRPGTQRGKLWRAAENYVLRNAVAEDQRVSAFTGPVFRPDDRAYRDIQIPGAFFKIVAWVEAGALRALALLADQSQVFREWPEALDAQEAFMDAAELDKVRDFLTTVAEVEALTGLDFGPLRDADMRAGQGRRNADAPPLGGDDLTRIKGIGASRAAALRALGVTRFAQIAAWGEAEIDHFADALGAGGRIRSRDWVGQARALMG